MKFSWNWLNEYLKKPLTPQQMAELLNLHAFEVESVERKGQDWVLDIKVLPNRAHDCLSHLGIAKEIAAISGSQFLPPKIKVVPDKSLKIKDFISVQVPAKDLCPRYSMMVGTDIKIGNSPKWMQERLISCGLRPINNIVDITNFVMLETGEPLHAFDVEKVGGKKIIVRRAQEGEEITTLEGKKYKLNQNNLVIADAALAIGIAGIKGGEGPEIDGQTKTVAVEAANFNQVNIRRTSKALKLKTDASTRFESGIDPELTIFALQRCLALIKDLAGGKADPAQRGGKVVSGIIDIYPKKVKPWKIILDTSQAQKLLGIQISGQQILTIFRRLGMAVRAIKKGKKSLIEVLVPTARLDLLTAEDLIEEIVRLYGYDKIPAEIPQGALVPAIKNENLVYEDKIKDILIGLGYSETYNYSLISQEDGNIFGFKNLISVRNPLSQDQKYLRPNLLVGLLKNLKENLKHFSGIRLFELGHIFEESAKGFLEENKIGAIICEKTLTRSTDNFFELKGVIDILFEKLGISDLWFDDQISGSHPWLKLVHFSRRAEIKVGDKLVGWIGEINPEILSAVEIKERPAVFELDFKQVVELASEERAYRPPSKYPAIFRDLAVIVDETTKIESVLNVIETAGGAMLQDTDLFDIYEDLAGNKKSLAFRLTYQSEERNLTDKEVNELQERIIKAVEERGWEIRK